MVRLSYTTPHCFSPQSVAKQRKQCGNETTLAHPGKGLSAGETSVWDPTIACSAEALPSEPQGPW